MSVRECMWMRVSMNVCMSVCVCELYLLSRFGKEPPPSFLAPGEMKRLLQNEFHGDFLAASCFVQFCWNSVCAIRWEKSLLIFFLFFFIDFFAAFLLSMFISDNLHILLFSCVYICWYKYIPIYLYFRLSIYLSMYLFIIYFPCLCSQPINTIKKIIVIIIISHPSIRHPDIYCTRIA